MADAIEDVGLRGVVARGMFGPMTDVAVAHRSPEYLFRYSIEEELEISLGAHETHENKRVGVWPAPINIVYNDQELVPRAVAMSHDLGTGWHAHCSEAEADPNIYLETYGIRPIDWLFEEGLLDERATIAHGIWLDDREVERMGQTGSCVSYNPTSNQYLASGCIRFRDLRAAGAVVSLGTDGPGCAHRQDMFEQMKHSILLQRVNTKDPTVSNAEEALELATREGSRYLGIDAGQLAAGKLADVVVVDLQTPHLRPLHRVVPTLVYSGTGSDVWMTIVDGEVVFEGGRCTQVDEAAVMSEAQARADELVKRAGLNT